MKLSLVDDPSWDQQAVMKALDEISPSSYRVEALSYSFKECCGPSVGVINVRGHINESVNVAHDLFRQLFPSTQRWRIYEVTYYPPKDDELASNGITTITARTL